MKLKVRRNFQINLRRTYKKKRGCRKSKISLKRGWDKINKSKNGKVKTRRKIKGRIKISCSISKKTLSRKRYWRGKKEKVRNTWKTKTWWGKKNLRI